MEKLSEATRESARRAYSEAARGSEAGAICGSGKKARVPHVELPISSDRDQFEVGYLRGPEESRELVRRLRHEILEEYGVPAQAVGESVNTERTAGNDRQAQITLSRFRSRVKRLRETVQGALRQLSSSAYGRQDVYVRLWPCIGTYNLDQLRPILTDDAARRLYACVRPLSLSVCCVVWS